MENSPFVNKGSIAGTGDKHNFTKKHLSTSQARFCTDDDICTSSATDYTQLKNLREMRKKESSKDNFLKVSHKSTMNFDKEISLSQESELDSCENYDVKRSRQKFVDSIEETESYQHNHDVPYVHTASSVETPPSQKSNMDPSGSNLRARQSSRQAARTEDSNQISKFSLTDDLPENQTSKPDTKRKCVNPRSHTNQCKVKENRNLDHINQGEKKEDRKDRINSVNPKRNLDHTNQGEKKEYSNDRNKGVNPKRNLDHTNHGEKENSNERRRSGRELTGDRDSKKKSVNLNRNLDCTNQDDEKKKKNRNDRSESGRDKDLGSKREREKMKEILSCMYTNADCWMNKRAKLMANVEAHQPDIIAATEVLPKYQRRKDETIQNAELEINDYDCFKTGPKGRGVCIYVRKHLRAVQVDELVDDDFKESMWCEVQLKDRDVLLFGCIYRSSSSTAENCQRLNQLVNKACERGVSHLVIVGDINYSEADWKTWPCDAGPAHPS